MPFSPEACVDLGLPNAAGRRLALSPDDCKLAAKYMPVALEVGQPYPVSPRAPQGNPLNFREGGFTGFQEGGLKEQMKTQESKYITLFFSLFCPCYFQSAKVS
jgi:hypothetical protein